MARINDGGPAFPSPVADDMLNKQGHNVAVLAGMTLRDWFAGQDADLANDTTARVAAEILGVEVPEHKAGGKVWLDFWMAWEAYRRYAFADAMLKQREKQ